MADRTNGDSQPLNVLAGNMSYVRHDLMYVQNWSIAVDLYILAETIPAVILRRGAY